jgi:hypothetical protein
VVVEGGEADSDVSGEGLGALSPACGVPSAPASVRESPAADPAHRRDIAGREEQDRVGCKAQRCVGVSMPWPV